MSESDESEPDDDESDDEDEDDEDFFDLDSVLVWIELLVTGLVTTEDNCFGLGSSSESSLLNFIKH